MLQRQVRIREVRFTLPFRTTITITTSRSWHASTTRRRTDPILQKVPVTDFVEARRPEFRFRRARTTAGKRPGKAGAIRTGKHKDLERSKKRRAPKARQMERETSGERETFRGTRASANTSGSDFSRALGPVKLRSKDSAPNEENLFLLPDRFWESELARNTIQPFDLMSRRHPLSSTRALRFRSASRSKPS